ncbi:MAG: chloride channel protein, partial [Planctomycetota bacterium]|jgi:CIC family chloride channel protein
LSENTYLIILAVAVGVLGGFGAIGFRLLIDGLQTLAIGEKGILFLDTLGELPWYYLLLLPAAGGLLIGPLVHFLAPEAKGHGVPEVMEAVALHGGRIRPRVVGVKSLASALCISTGGSIGREGPIVQIGSAIGSTLGQILKLRPDRIRILVGCGAAAGIAATFNAPVAGVLFAIELILGNYAITTLTPLIISSVGATVICHVFPAITGGDVRAFVIEPFNLASAWEIPLYFGLGLAAALVAIAFMRTLYFSEDIFDKLPIPGWLKAPMGGLMLGGIFLASPHVVGEVHLFGMGYQSIEMAMRGELVWTALIALVAMKIVATTVTLGSGGSGGIFAPSLFLGAMTGGVFGWAMHSLFPGVAVHPGAYVLVGMGAVVAGTTHAPITAIIMLFELTGDYQIILPIMIACILASLITSRAKKDSIYTEKLSRRGVNLNQGFETTIIGSARVGDVIRRDAPTVRENETLNHVLQGFLGQHVMQVYVLDENDRLRGVIHLNDVITLITEAGLGKAIIAADVMEQNFPTASLDEPLSDVFRKFGTCHLEEIPVLEKELNGPQKFLGVVTRRSLFLYYNREVLRQSALGLKFVHREGEEEESDYVWMPQDHEVKVTSVPSWMAGKCLKDLDLRNRYRVNVVAIRSHRYATNLDTDVPSPERVLKPSETLVVVGSHEDIEDMLKGEGKGKDRSARPNS